MNRKKRKKKKKRTTTTTTKENSCCVPHMSHVTSQSTFAYTAVSPKNRLLWRRSPRSLFHLPEHTNPTSLFTSNKTTIVPIPHRTAEQKSIRIRRSIWVGAIRYTIRAPYSQGSILKSRISSIPGCFLHGE